MTTQYLNPLFKKKADPWIYKHTDGYYYFTASSPAFDRIELIRAKTFEGLRDEEPITVREKHEERPLRHLIWAPEIHYLRGKGYIDIAAAPTATHHTEQDTRQHRM